MTGGPNSPRKFSLPSLSHTFLHLKVSKATGAFASSFFYNIIVSNNMKLIRRSSLLLSHDNSHFKTAAAGDDFSVSSEGSTFSVSAHKVEGPIHLPFQSCQQRRRQVQFDEGQNVYHSNTVMTKDECQSLWHSRVDMKNFKQTTRAIAVEIHRSEKANTAPNSYARVVLAAYAACCRAVCDTNVSPLDNKEQKNLRKWMQVAVSRTGLDRSSIREIALERHQRRQHIAHVVMEMQESLVYREDLDQVIRKASEAISRPSRLFAREIAEAQASM